MLFARYLLDHPVSYRRVMLACELTALAMLVVDVELDARLAELRLQEKAPATPFAAVRRSRRR
jgi:hypothetical protein